MNAYDELFLQAMNTEESDSSDDLVQTGKVIARVDKGYFIGATGKSELFLPDSEVVGEVTVGEQIEFVAMSQKDGIPQVSQKKANHIQLLASLDESVENQLPIQAKVQKLVLRDGNPVGYEVLLGSVKAFLPMSHTRKPENPQDLEGATFDVVVLKKERDRVVVSERVLRDAQQNLHFDNFVANHKVGDRLSAVVETVTNGYALLKTENIVAFMHVTEFDWKFTKDLTAVIKSGDNLDVIITSIDTTKKSIRVSRKEAIVNPMEVFFQARTMGDDLSVKVLRFARGLAVLEDDNGVEMILPVAEMSWINKVSDPKQLLNIGDRIQVRVKEMDASKNRIVVSLRELLENPWIQAETKYAVNTQHKGTVANITDFGLFLAFEDGIQGLVRREDIDWNDSNVDMNARFNKGDELVAMVMNIDSKNEKLRLGIKQLSENPYQNFANAHPEGSVITVTVSSLQKDGVEVVADQDIKGFIHISQLSNERVNDPKEVCKEGDQLQVAVRRINLPQQKIEFSVRELQVAEEKQAFEAVMKEQNVETPTLGAMFGNILKKK